MFINIFCLRTPERISVGACTAGLNSHPSQVGVFLSKVGEDETWREEKVGEKRNDHSIIPFAPPIFPSGSQPQSPLPQNIYQKEITMIITVA